MINTVTFFLVIRVLYRNGQLMATKRSNDIAITVQDPTVYSRMPVAVRMATVRFIPVRSCSFVLRRQNGDIEVEASTPKESTRQQVTYAEVNHQ